MKCSVHKFCASWGLQLLSFPFCCCIYVFVVAFVLYIFFFCFFLFTSADFSARCRQKHKQNTLRHFQHDSNQLWSEIRVLNISMLFYPFIYEHVIHKWSVIDSRSVSYVIHQAAFTIFETAVELSFYVMIVIFGFSSFFPSAPLLRVAIYVAMILFATISSLNQFIYIHWCFFLLFSFIWFLFRAQTNSVFCIHMFFMFGVFLSLSFTLFLSLSFSHYLSCIVILSLIRSIPLLKHLKVPFHEL